MIVFVDMEHEVSLQSERERAIHDQFTAHVRRKLEATSGRLCVVKAFRGVSRGWLRELRALAIVISGNAADWPNYSENDLREMVAIIRSGEWPIMGLCGGMQLIAQAYGVGTRLMGRLAPGEVDIGPQYGPGLRKEWGYLPVRKTADDPIWRGMADQPVFLFAHYLELERLPPGFVNIAATDRCPIELIRHRDRPVYGTQFHPEAFISQPGEGDNWLVDFVYPGGYDGPLRPDGRRFFENFFRLAGVIPE